MVDVRWIGSPNHRARAGNVRHIDLHWMVGNLRGTDAIFQRPGGTATHYGIENGVVHQYVAENRRAPGTGNNYANTHGISIEHAGGWLLPDGTRFKPSEATHETSAQLCAAISQRHGLGALVPGKNIYPHNHWVATQCPGSLDLAWIAKRANEIMGQGPAPAPTPAPGPAGQVAPPFPWPDSHYIGPRYPLSNRYSISGFHSGRDHVRVFQQQLKNRGWDFSRHGVDGLYGDEFRENVIAFQREKGLNPDGLVGPNTWRAAWESPIS